MTNVELARADAFVEAPAFEWVWTEEFEEELVEDRFVHTTVMKSEVVRALAPRAGGLYVDATLGGGGHTEAILEADPEARVVAFDRDETAIRASRERLARFEGRVTFVHAPFGEIRERLAELGIHAIDGICADLGVSSPQLDDPDRGMSFRREGPIDMRMDKGSGETALELIERLSDDELADVLYKFGDERRSRRIARSIKRAQVQGELGTTLDLRRAVVRAVGPVRVGGVDPATRTFQALRIAVNGELEQLEDLLAALPTLVAPGGVAAFLSFHSLEDKRVKSAFQEKATWIPLWKKPLGPSDDERVHNIRSRTAKLRAARRPGGEVPPDPSSGEIGPFVQDDDA
jgi:16S rRNA (cytosine1402-N4)-methyltransferase